MFFIFSCSKIDAFEIYNNLGSSYCKTYAKNCVGNKTYTQDSEKLYDSGTKISYTISSCYYGSLKMYYDENHQYNYNYTLKTWSKSPKGYIDTWF